MSWLQQPQHQRLRRLCFELFSRAVRLFEDKSKLVLDYCLV